MVKDNMNILFTSSGRRVALIKKFKEAFTQEGITGNVITADLKTTAPTVFFSDNHYIVPRVTEDRYIEELLTICRKERIFLIIPLIDTELLLLAKSKQLFEEIGVKVLVSSKELNEISNNKVNTYKFFASHNILTPKVYSNEEINEKKHQFPLLIKPYNGSSSKGVTRIRNEKELNFFKDYIPGAMVQEYVWGEEYTIDVMVDFNSNIKTIVPRLRIETRAGEISKGVTKKDMEIIKAAEKVVNVLPNPVGCITLQCFKKENGEITFIEINPRFGGGIPLSIEAGANFPLWTIQMCQGEIFKEKDFSWKENLTMLRYDEAIFTENLQYVN
ncbi:TPA: ATP-grasp domain-containing protein [Bacillus pseudomycoides]|nr:ATP-grasp domain-containing protein [Bacillus pseudomycoides]